LSLGVGASNVCLEKFWVLRDQLGLSYYFDTYAFITTWKAGFEFKILRITWAQWHMKVGMKKMKIQGQSE
jgi:hypothetical protein